ncbi:MAG: hypothetical protein IPP56_06140 [Bacteroidetes bacterium]|nr:hypothetical protein [Bacteroidota bacterium]MBK9671361.1 hypothetical protein [Bacteroidota bacterium]MBK9799321.1 hypothetical protein [Bacteroidota bacterium]MBP6412220.1 hypothetical protein [Bacteroidia bacterium]
MNRILLVITVLLFIGLAATQTACKKKTDTKAVITVEDSLGQILPGATVYINSKNNTPPGIIEDSQVSDTRGKTFHTFANEAILQVEVTKAVNGKTLEGYGILRLEEGKTVDLTVKTN